MEGPKPGAKRSVHARMTLMLIFLDETFRSHRRTGSSFGALCGVAIPEDVFATFQGDFFRICRPYFGQVLEEGQDVHGKNLLNRSTLKNHVESGYSAKWSMAEDLLQYSNRAGIRVFGVVCFRSDIQSFICGDESKMDITFQYLFERIDRFMRDQFPKRQAKLVFDDRGSATNRSNARAIANFFMKSRMGTSYDTIIKTPFVGVSKANNYGLQLADLVTTVVGIRFQGDKDEIADLFRIVSRMLFQIEVGSLRQSSLKVMR